MNLIVFHLESVQASSHFELVVELRLFGLALDSIRILAEWTLWGCIGPTNNICHSQRGGGGYRAIQYQYTADHQWMRGVLPIV